MTEPSPAAEWVTLAEAVRQTARTAVQIRTLAALGRIRVDAPPGCRVRYRRADLAALQPQPATVEQPR